MGVSVNDTNADAAIATVTTTANSLKMRPMIPPISSTGMNTATSDTVIDMIVKPISRLPFSAASKGSEPFLLHVAIDVLQHDDGIVDHEAHRQRQAQQRDIVDAEIEQIHRSRAWRSARSAPPAPE